MPSHYLHKKINKFLLGKEYEDVNIFLDFPYKFFGPKHREVFGHDPTSLLLLYLITKDKEKFKAGLLHVLTDFVIRDKKTEIFISKVLDILNDDRGSKKTHGRNRRKSKRRRIRSK